MEQLGRKDIGAGVNLNSEGMCIGQFMCNIADPLGGNQFYTGFNPLVEVQLWDLMFTHV